MEQAKSKLLKSVIIRFKERQNRLLIDKDTIPHFETFLKESVGSDIVIINTNISLGIYYSSKNNCSELIKRSVLIYTIKRIDTANLSFDYNLNYNDVRMSFIDGFYTFSQYPQLFLAYAKKFVYIREQHGYNKIVMPYLNNFYEQVLKELHKKEQLPFSKKIMNADGAFFIKKRDPLLYNLASRIASKEHFN